MMWPNRLRSWARSAPAGVRVPLVRGALVTVTFVAVAAPAACGGSSQPDQECGVSQAIACPSEPHGGYIGDAGRDYDRALALCVRLGVGGLAQRFDVPRRRNAVLGAVERGANAYPGAARDGCEDGLRERRHG
jgi:hypothetical protein